MRSFRFLLITFALLICFYTVAAAPGYPLARRQDDIEPSRTSFTVTESSRPSSTTRPQESSTAQSDSGRPSTTEAPTSRTSVVVTSSTAPASPTATASGATTNGTESGNVSTDPLPLHPKITPALGLIGALFLISGVLYAVIGIKNKWIYVFGSAAYLTALAVTVLIIYLMSPPVSNAVQGAFFVAAFITGVLFGALALIFSDLTEGLGCLLGGYCLSMWFLSLKEGGLITSTAGRAIFIGCFSVAGYSLSFSRYTRTYGLIGSISFSGATIAMLGVDCFSRAGWKEFWLYLWNLNSDVFPLNTNTYPLTKGIKVELAGVVILCIFGIISQLRLWKLIKERRDKKEEHRQQTAQNQQKEEEELGRKIEDNFHKERSQWEATYGNRSLHDSGHATPESPSLYEKEYLSTTLASTTQFTKPGSTNSSDKHANVTVAPVHEDEIQPIDARGAPLPILKDDAVNHSTIVSRTNSTRPSSEAVAASQISRSVSITSSLKPSAPPPPVIVPLPFRIPQEDDAKSQLSDNASVSALPDTQEDEHPSNQPLLPHRLSGKPAMKRLSTNRTSSDGFQAEDVVMLSKLEDDRASSVAATLDEEDKISLRAISPPHSPLNGGFALNEPVIEDLENAVDNSNVDLEAHKNGGLRNNGTMIEDEGASTTRSIPKTGVQTADMLRSQPAGQISPSSFGNSRQSLTISTDPKNEDARRKHDLAQSPRLRHDTLVKGDSDKSQSSEAANPNGSSSTSQDDKSGSIIGDLPNSLPARLSRVAQSYRTNEWAKHLETAEKPELDEIPEPESPGAQLDHERPAPVSEGIAQPFATSKRISKRVSSDSTVHRNNAFMQINSNSARQSHSELPSLSRQASQTLDRGVRVSGTQLPSVVDPVGRRVSSGPTQLPNQTLMGKRESLMRNRVSTQNFNQQTGSSNDLTAVNDEDMTLAQRRRALKYQKPPSASQKWQKNSWAAAPVEGFDSHQPKRTVGTGSDQKREVLLAGWRESIQQTGAPLQSPAAREEQQRAVLMNAKRQKDMEKQQQTLISQHRESMRHNMMRSNEMLDAHREAMRRMQAAANKNA